VYPSCPPQLLVITLTNVTNRSIMMARATVFATIPGPEGDRFQNQECVGIPNCTPVGRGSRPLQLSATVAGKFIVLDWGVGTLMSCPPRVQECPEGKAIYNAESTTHEANKLETWNNFH
jgi:hypothetical protein